MKRDERTHATRLTSCASKSQANLGPLPPLSPCNQQSCVFEFLEFVNWPSPGERLGSSAFSTAHLRRHRRDASFPLFSHWKILHKRGFGRSPFAVNATHCQCISICGNSPTDSRPRRDGPEKSELSGVALYGKRLALVPKLWIPKYHPLFRRDSKTDLPSITLQADPSTSHHEARQIFDPAMDTLVFLRRIILAKAAFYGHVSGYIAGHINDCVEWQSQSTHPQFPEDHVNLSSTILPLIKLQFMR